MINNLIEIMKTHCLPMELCNVSEVANLRSDLGYYLFFPPDKDATPPFERFDFFVIRDDVVEILVKALLLENNRGTLVPLGNKTTLVALKEALVAGAQLYAMCSADYFNVGVMFDIPSECFQELPDRTMIPGKWQQEEEISFSASDVEIRMRIPVAMQQVVDAGAGEMTKFFFLVREMIKICGRREKDFNKELALLNNMFINRLRKLTS